ncbi:MAG TPA: polyhydroxyalkanoic acid system family protein [Thermoanaerobaculia bacterium]
MHVTVDHKTTRQAARSKIELRLSHLLGQFGAKVDELEHEWIGDTLHFKGKARGMKVEGTVEVTESEVVIDGKLPLIAMPFESKIKQAVKQEADAMFRTA